MSSSSELRASDEFRTLQKSHRRRGFSKLILSTSSWPWVFAEFFVAASSFEAGARLSHFSAIQRFHDDNIVTSLVFAAVLCLVGIGVGLFEREARLSRLSALRTLMFALILSLSLSLTLVHFVFFIQPGRYALIFGSSAAFLALSLWHVLLSWLGQIFPQGYVFLGPKSDMSLELDRALRAISDKPHLRDRLSTIEESLFLDKSPDSARDFPERALSELIDAGVTDLVLTQRGSEDPRVSQVAVRALQYGLRVMEEPALYAELLRKYPVSHLSIHWAIGAGFDIHRPFTNFFKRAFDIVVASLMLIILSPLLLMLMLAVKLSGPGPIFFVQVRQGRYFRPFRMVKFRSMRLDQVGSRVTSKADSRVTRIGSIMRPLHFDEFPQLWNILKGDMSFVGPRPAMLDTIREMREKLPLFEIRQMIRPGLTGLAQISQGYSLDSEDELQEKLGFDLFYVRHYSVAMDLWVMLRTGFNLARKAW